MKLSGKKIIAFTGAFLYATLGLSPLWADDTEIYFGNNGTGATANVLFILDTSGSMDTDDDHNGTSRMDDLKTAFKSIMTNVHNVNVGLMRYSNPGGPVLYPVSYIDKEVSLTSTASTATSSVTDANNDGYQFITSGQVVLDTKQLEMGANAISGVTIQTINKQVGSNNNDAESRISDGNLTLNGSYLDTPGDGNDQVNGIRFTGVNIPAGATIVSAYVEMQVGRVDGWGSEPVEISVLGEKADPGADFSVNNESPLYRYSNHALTTSDTWAFDTMPATDDLVRTPDVSDIIQQIVNQSGTSNTSNITLLMVRKSGNTSHQFIGFTSYDRSHTNAPRLVVQYYTGTATAAAVVTALRFANIDIPRNAKITSAKITFNAATSSATSTSLTIQAEKTGNSAALNTTSFNITGRTKTTASVPWTLTDWTASTTYDTPDLSTVVQEVVNNTGSSTDPNDAGFGWCGGNAMTFLINGDTGRRLAQAYENGSSTAPVLTIQYDTKDIATGQGCMKKTVTAQIANNSDDAEQRNNTMALNDDTLELVAKNNVAQKVGFKFTNVQVPKNAKITSAYLDFVSGSASANDTMSLTIQGEDIDNAPTYSNTDNNISSRTKTSQSVTWSNIGQWAYHTDYTSPDVSSIVQAIVDRSGWASGNSMNFIVTGTSTSRVRYVRSRDDKSSQAARLTINYIDLGTSSKTTVRDKLISIVDNFSAAGNTPIQDVMYEAALYYKGMAVDYGKVRGGGPYAYTRVSHPDSMVPGTYSISPDGCTDSSDSSCKYETISGIGGQPMYQSPITASCQKNYVVLLTDGRPNSPHSKDKIKSLIGFNGTCAEENDNDEACVTELAKWMNTTDLSSSVDGDETVTTSTIGFNIQDDWLSKIATAGGGQYYEATDAANLAPVLEKILGSAQVTNTTFVSAGTAVNAFNRTLNRDELYFSVFKPSAYARWFGNVKKYKLAAAPSTDILDAKGSNAIAPSGFFADGSQSFWSTSADGPDVTKGGAASRVTDYTTRKLYTYLSGLGASSSKMLSASVNAVTSSNTNLTNTVMGTSYTSATDLANLIDWVRGKVITIDGTDVNSTTRFVYDDPLHSRPVAVTYGGTEASPDMTLFTATNAGVLHAIDNDTGNEVFSFIPEDLLPLQKTLYDNAESNGHPYGLDGSIVTWVVDPDGDGVVLDGSGNVESGNKVYLYVGMRRGGRNYYALDVTDRNNPKILWIIKGGTTAGFNNLGQTWSQPLKAMIKIGSTTHRALIFSGGYDTNQDTSTKRDAAATDTVGNAIYIVDADDGSLLWSGSSAADATKTFSDMKYSIPGSVVGADLSGDGLIDLLFVGDTGGQVWRFDINNGQSAANLVTGGVIADINDAANGGVATAAGNRRFYHSPALFLGLNGATPYLGVAIGSGWRAHPLDTATTNRFYMIRQKDIFTAPSTYTKLYESDLYDATDNLIGQGTAAQQATASTELSNASGWYITLNNQGEKVLSTPLVVEGQLFFDTYQPGSVDNSNPCQPTTGINRSYQMSAFDATPPLQGQVSSDRSTIINAVGIIDQQRQLIRLGDDGHLTSIGIEGTSAKNLPSDLLTKVHRIYWYENR